MDPATVIFILFAVAILVMIAAIPVALMTMVIGVQMRIVRFVFKKPKKKNRK